MTAGEIILVAIVFAGLSASYWSLAKIADAVNQIHMRTEGSQRSEQYIQELAHRSVEIAERSQQSVERIAQYLARGPRS